VLFIEGFRKGTHFWRRRRRILWEVFGVDEVVLREGVWVI
jgi:hypothetical protein